MKKLICDMDLAREHELLGTDILVFSALCYLCYRGDWELNYTKLAEEARCGSADTATRVCKKLVQLHLITIVNKKVHICIKSTPQNAESTPQIAEFTPQNAEFTPQNAEFCEKESTKEKEKKNK